MKNLYDEIVEELKFYDKTINDIHWIGTRKYKVDKDKFLEDAKKLNYDNGYGLEVINLDLVIVGNGWYLSRWEYDGSEGFNYFTMLETPDKEIEYTRDFIIPVTYLRDYLWEDHDE